MVAKEAVGILFLITVMSFGELFGKHLPHIAPRRLAYENEPYDHGH